MTVNRIAHLLVALLALAGIGLQYAIILRHHPEGLALRSIRFVSFFTILTNMLVGVTALAIAAGRGRLCRWAVRPDHRTAVALHILIVAIVFHAVLRHMVPPGAIGWWANMLVHQATPAAWTLCWLLFRPHGGIAPGAPLHWMLYPLVYVLWTLIHGALGGWYPYPFLDVAKLGYPAALLNIAVVAAAFLSLGYALRWLDGRLADRR